MNIKAMKQPKNNKKQINFVKNFKKNYPLWLFVLPGIIITFIFSYIPLYGVQIAFRNFNPKLGFFW